MKVLQSFLFGHLLLFYLFSVQYLYLTILSKYSTLNYESGKHKKSPLTNGWTHNSLEQILNCIVTRIITSNLLEKHIIFHISLNKSE